MKNISINAPPLEPAPKAATSQTRAWQIDQILKLRAETSSNSTGQLIVRIGNLKVTASTPVPIKAGETFTAQIQSLGQMPILKIISTFAGPERAVTQYLRESLPKQGDFDALKQKLIAISKPEISLPRPVKMIAQAIISSLPTLDRLATPAQIKSAITNSGVFLESTLASTRANSGASKAALLFDLKAQLLKFRSAITQQLADTLRGASNELPTSFANVASPSNTRSGTAPLLQQAISLFNGGKLSLAQLVKAITLYLPGDQIKMLMGQLADTKEPLLKQPRDLPEALFKLLQSMQLQSNPARTIETLLALLRNVVVLQELQQLTESALNRIQATQLASITRDTGSNFFLLVDLPIQHEEDVQNNQLQFEKSQSEDDSEELWTVTMNFNFPELGPIQVRLKLQENHLATRFEADRHETVSSIREHLPQLNQALEKLGLSIDHLSVEQGKTDHSIRLSDNHNLLDEMA